MILKNLNRLNLAQQGNKQLPGEDKSCSTDPELSELNVKSLWVSLHYQFSTSSHDPLCHIVFEDLITANVGVFV